MRATPSILIAVALAGWAIETAPASPYAVEVVNSRGPFGASAYGDPNAVLGAPATWFYDSFSVFSGGATNRRAKLVEAAFNVAAGPLPTNLLVTLGGGSRIIARFDHPVADNPANPYGIDLLVFGNTFYTPNTVVNDGTDMGGCLLTGGSFSEPLKISVSPGFTGLPGEVSSDPDSWPWYRYDAGPYADTVFPTQAYKWSRATAGWTTEMMDFTKPVNPAMKTVLGAGGMSAADAIDLYAGSGGGTGFDLGASGFSWIQYIKVEGVDPDFSEGEIDAFSIVRPMVVGDALSITPENIAGGAGALIFQEPGAGARNQVSLVFNDLGGIALVSTAPLTNFSPFAPLPGIVLNAVQLEISPLLGQDAPIFNAAIALSAGQEYSGAGADLVVLQSSGTNWHSRSFTYDHTRQQAVAGGVTNLSAFAVVRFSAPRLAISLTTGGWAVSFTPVPGLLHTLERSTNLATWTPLGAFTATNALPVSFEDNSAPPDRACYRVKVSRP